MKKRVKFFFKTHLQTPSEPYASRGLLLGFYAILIVGEPSYISLAVSWLFNFSRRSHSFIIFCQTSYLLRLFQWNYYGNWNSLIWSIWLKSENMKHCFYSWRVIHKLIQWKSLVSFKEKRVSHNLEVLFIYYFF